jgi:hypothetical protein
MTALSDVWTVLLDTTVSVAAGIAIGLLLASRFRITKARTPNTDDNGVDP